MSLLLKYNVKSKYFFDEIKICFEMSGKSEGNL